MGGEGALIHTYTHAHTYLLTVIDNGGVHQTFLLGNTSWAYSGIVLLGTFVIGEGCVTGVGPWDLSRSAVCHFQIRHLITNAILFRVGSLAKETSNIQNGGCFIHLGSGMKL